MNSNNWKIEYDIPDISPALSEAGFNPLLSYVLATRGITSPEAAKKLLFSTEEILHDPFLMSGMDAAVNRIKKAIAVKEKVAVYGDYDVDGITSTCLLTDYLRSHGVECIAYIPDRNDEGYGLNCGALDSFKEQGISLVITVDCGITAVSETDHANTLGIDMIITDHHECKDDVIPNAVAVIDCKQSCDCYPNQELAGVGVAFKLVCACENNTEQILEKYSDLVAIGTIADVMPLVDENRYLVSRGIDMLKQSPRPGITAMLKETRIDPSSISATTIGFILAPKLNAAGRLGDAITAGDLILSTDEKEAGVLARELLDLNRKRQGIESEIWKQAEKMLAVEPAVDPIVLADSGWHQGVIGIAASRIAEHHALPTIMICLNGDVGKGSCRSYGGFNLYDALSACSEHLISFGGHALAAGLNIEAAKIESFKKALAEYYRTNKPEPKPDITCEVLINDPSILTEDNVRSLDLLEPYGNGNPKPVMCMLGVKVESAVNVGNGRHLKMRVSYDDFIFDCIFFSHTLKEFAIQPGDLIDLAFSPQLNEYNDKISVQLLVSGLRKHSYEDLCLNAIENGCTYSKPLSRFCPERPDFIKAWKSLGCNPSLGSNLSEILELCPEDMPPEMYCICLSVFREAGLLVSDSECLYGACFRKLSQKADLEGTRLLRSLRKHSR